MIPLHNEVAEMKALAVKECSSQRFLSGKISSRRKSTRTRCAVKLVWRFDFGGPVVALLINRQNATDWRPGTSGTFFAVHTLRVASAAVVAA